MKQLLALFVLGFGLNTFATESASADATQAAPQVEQVVLFDRTNGAKAEAVKPVAEKTSATAVAPKATKPKAAKKSPKAAAVPAKTEAPAVKPTEAAVLEKVIEKDGQKDLTVDGKSRFNKDGNPVVVVPVAKPGYISGVTAAGEIVMIPTVEAKNSSTIQPAAWAATAQPPAAPAPADAAVNAPETAPASTTDELADAKVEEEVNAASVPAAGENTAVVENQNVKKSKMYVTGVLGAGGYPTVSNINQGYALSAALGYNFTERISGEAGMVLAQYKMDIRNTAVFVRRDDYDVNQYGAYVAAKYHFDNLFNTKFKPNVGASLLYSYRDYKLTNFNTSGNSNTTGNSNAWDAGLSAGVDYMLGAKYTVGVDVKYMFNLANRINNTYINPTFGYTGSQLESLQYYTAGLSATVNF